ncbi:MAG: ribosome-associated translation inhibitor RaiA [Candidatus Latescibacterota bacterium]
MTSTARQYELTPALKDYAENKVYHLKHYFDQIVNAHIRFSVEKYRHMVEITVHINGRDFKSTDESEDMYASVDGAVEKLERQILKHKGKRQKRKSQSKRPDADVSDALDLDEDAGAETAPVNDMVEAKLEEFPSLSLEDAVREMRGNGIDMKIFANSDTQKVNVIYMREDGTVGVIEAK